MIELKDFPELERKKIVCNLEYFSYLIWRKDNSLRQAHNTLVKIVGEEYTQELWVVLTHISQAIRYESDGYRLSLKNDHYSAANKRFNIKLSSRRMKESPM